MLVTFTTEFLKKIDKHTNLAYRVSSTLVDPCLYTMQHVQGETYIKLEIRKIGQRMLSTLSHRNAVRC